MFILRRGEEIVTISSSRLAGIILLLLAALVVAVAILTSGPVSRGVNGVGGIMWITSLVLLWRALGAGRRPFFLLGAAATFTLVLVQFVKPSDLLSAAIGFGVAGLLIGLIARRGELLWAAMVPALWLPAHLSIAISSAILETADDQAAAIRTDPPPTEAFVPLMMVVAAVAGGFVALGVRRSWRLRGATDTPSHDAAVGTPG